MAISPPLIPGEDAFNAFNALADKLAAKLSSAFGYTPSEAEQYIRTFYDECESSEPQRRKQLRDSDVSEHGAWADDHARFRAAEGGDVTVKSAEGEGSTFTLSVSAGLAAPMQIAA
jgi:hypothetical protein